MGYVYARLRVANPGERWAGGHPSGRRTGGHPGGRYATGTGTGVQGGIELYNMLALQLQCGIVLTIEGGYGGGGAGPSGR
jgi:hypothetical protein